MKGKGPIFTRSMMRVTAVFMSALLILCTVVSEPVNIYAMEQTTQTTLVEWNFNDRNATADGGVEQNLGKKFYYDKIRKTDGFIESYMGQYFDSMVSDPVDYATRISGWVYAGTSTIKVLALRAEMTTKGYGSLKLSSRQFSKPTGPRDFKVQYSIDNQNWTDIPGGDIKVGTTVGVDSNGGVLSNISLPPEAENRDKLYVRWVITSDINVDGGTISPTASTYLDNVKITGEPIGQDAVKVTGIAVSGAAQITAKAGTARMTAAIAPDNAYNKTVTWGVYNLDGTPTDIAAINDTGLLTAIKNGTVKVVAASNDGSDVKGETQVVISGQVEKELYNHYYGQLHSHTNLSDGAGTPEDAYAWARDQGKADFFAITDHSNSFDNEFASENITRYQDSTSSKWKSLNSAADSFNEDGRFVAIAGFEMTWSNTAIGHINTFNTPWFMSRDKGTSMQEYYEKLKQYPQSISQFNHPGTTFGYFEQFGRYSPEVDAVINLIEVGNGDGPIRGSGYFPSYEYYTMALDRGWHVAPSNNQDNHKKQWITANTARTVVLAHNLTRNDIFNAIRNHRVYSTEDKNLKVSYYVNDQVMGSRISDVNNLHFDIKVDDPDLTDSIKSISVIADGGEVLKSSNFTGRTADWSFDIANTYSYYYLKIVELDGDICVTAPVWSDTSLPVGISSMTVSQNPTTPGTQVNLEAVLYNNTPDIVNNINIEFNVGDTKIGEKTIASITGGGMQSASIQWIPEETGNKLVTAKASFSISGTVKESSAATTVNVLQSGTIKRVVIDGGHYNAYVTGNYAGGYTELKELLDSNNFITDINMDALTAQDLAGANILILSDPGSTDDTYTHKSFYTPDELKAISDFVKAGGSVMTTSTADYGEKSKGVTGDYQSAAQNNKVLEAIGSNMRFNDDELYDTSNNVGGMPYKLDFGSYITPGKYGIITQDIMSQKFRVYSSSSVITKNGGNSDAIDWLVNLHPTTTSYDSDGSSDSSNPTAGNFHVIGVEQLEGGRVVAAGATFFSNFEFDNALESTLANKKIMLNILNWMASDSSHPVQDKVSIRGARMDADKNGIPDRLGEKVTVEGVVTAESTAYTEKNGRNNAFFDCIYIQDETGGMTVFKVSSREIPIGAKVKVIGTIDQYMGDTEIQVANEAADLTVINPGPIKCDPRVMSTGDSMKEENEGWLVQLQGQVTKIESDTLYINDGSGEARVFVDGYIGDGTGNNALLGKWNSSIKVGDSIKAIGLASEDSLGHRIRVRNTSEVGAAITKPAPLLNADATQNFTGRPIEISFQDDSEWRLSINSILLDGNALDTNKYIVNEGKVIIQGSAFTTAKLYNIVIKAVGYQDASTVQDICSKSRAVIDGGHSNIYVSGDYSNKGTGMKEVLSEKGLDVVVNNDALTADDLNGATLLILTDPGSTAALSGEELAAVGNYVKSGGSLIITSRADFKEADGDYQNSVQGNKVLEAVGSKIRFNDDEVLDGDKYTIYFSSYETMAGSNSSRFGLVKPENTAQQFRIYSASSVYLMNGASDTNIDWIISPSPTTKGEDKDNKNDRVSPPDGKLHMLGGELLSGGGKVVAAGATFFSDYEIVGTSYANRHILSNIIDWMKTVRVPKRVESIQVSTEDDVSEIKEGHTLQMLYSVNPADADDSSVSWSVYNTDDTATDLAEIDSNGLLTAKKYGTVKVIAAAKDGSGIKGEKLIAITSRQEEATAVITGPNTIAAGQEFTISLGLASVTQSVYAQDLTVVYDASLFEFRKADAANNNVVIAAIDDSQPGKLRILSIVIGGSNGNIALANMVFSAKNVQNQASGIFAVLDVKLGTSDSQIITAANAQRAVAIGTTTDKSVLLAAITYAQSICDAAVVGTSPGQYPQAAKNVFIAAIAAAQTVANNSGADQAQVNAAAAVLNAAVAVFRSSVIVAYPGDISSDGRKDVIDLAIVAKYYHAKAGDANWNQAKAADVAGGINGGADGMVDIIDLVYVAKEILKK